MSGSSNGWHLGPMLIRAVACVAFASSASAQDNHGDSVEMATLLSIGPPQIGVISGADDVDYYRIDLPSNATLIVSTAGPTDTRGELLDGTGARIASDDNSGPGGRNFSITEALASGAYYVAVRANASGDAEGSYALTAMLAHDGDLGGTAASSALLTLHGAAQAESVTSIDESALSTVSRIDEAMTDLDYFRIDVPKGATDVTVRSVASNDAAGRLLDSSLAEVAADDDGDFEIETQLDAGTYYLEVTGEIGDYRVIASASDDRCDCAQQATTRTDHGDTAQSSTLMPIGPPLIGEIADATDVDVFRIDLAGNATVVFETAGPTDTQGLLRNGRLEQLARADTGGPAANFRISADLTPGVYYLDVFAPSGNGGATGSYAVTARIGGESDHGDTAALSTLLPLYSQAEVDNVKPSALLSTAAAIESTGDVDMFRLDVPRDRTDVTIRSAGTLDTYARLRDASLNELAMDDGDGGFRIEATLDAGIYYVEVGGHETGRYRILAWGDSREPCDCADEASSAASDLVVESASADNASPDAGASFTLWATVRNQGNGRSDATLLRYYRSADATISSQDVHVGTDSIGALEASAASSQSITLAAPTTAGTYHYGACVVAVPGESNTANNCSSGVQVIVAGGGGGGTDSHCRDGDRIEPGNRCEIFGTSFYFEVDASGQACANLFGAPVCGTETLLQSSGGALIDARRNAGGSWTINDVEPEPGGDSGGSGGDDDRSADDPATEFDLDDELHTPSGIVYANGRLYVVDYSEDKVYAYTVDGVRDPAADFDLDDENVFPYGIAYSNGRFHVLDTEDNKVYAYTADGARDPAADFDLDDESSSPTDITYANGRFHVADFFGEISAYTTDGTRDSAADFYVAGIPAGITYANGRFHVINILNSQNNVYAFTSDGARDSAADFDLDVGNGKPEGIAYANGRFHVLDGSDGRVYVYTADGTRVDGGTGTDTAGDFELADENISPFAIAYANGRFHVGDYSDDKVYAYTADGARDSAADFDFDGENGSPRGIAYANGRFHVLDTGNNKVYAYTTDGSRAPSVDFDLDDENSRPQDIAYANGRFYVPDWPRKVYAYTADGVRDSAADFHLGNSPSAITYANGRFYVPASIEKKVYAYTVDGARDSAADFDLDRENGWSTGIAYANGRFYVLDYSDAKVYAYTADSGTAPGGGGGSDSFCRDGDRIEPGSRCEISGTSFYLEVDSSGRACANLFGAPTCATEVLQQRNGGALIDASRNAGGSWTISNVEPEPGGDGGDSDDGDARSGDDHGDTRSGASSLALGSSLQGSIETGDDIDYFRVQVSGSGTLTVYSTGSLDAEGELQDSSGTGLAHDSDSGTGLNFRIEHAVSAGTYYVKVESWSSGTGDYTVHASFQESTGGGGGGSTDSFCRDGDRIEPGGRCEISGTSFYVEVDSSGRACANLFGAPACATEVLQQRSGGALIDASRNAGGSWTINDVEPEPSGESGGGSGDDDRSGDDHGDTRSAATSLSLDSSRQGRIETGNDVDYFSVQVSGSGTLTVYSTGSLDAEGELQDSSGTVLARDSDSGSGFNFRIEQSVTAGTYYVKVESWSSGTGDYTVHVSLLESAGGGGTDSVCRVGDTIERGNRCTISGTSFYFAVDASASEPGPTVRACSNLFGERVCETGTLVHISGTTLIWARISAGSNWTIQDVQPKPADGGTSPANRPPAVVAPIRDRTMRVGESLTIDLTPVFSDPDGDRITSFGFERSNGNVSGSVTLNNAAGTGQLNLEGVSTGTTFVSVSAYDGQRSGWHEFVVTVAEGGSGGGDGEALFGAVSVHLRSCTDIPVGISLNHDSEARALDAAQTACQNDGGTAAGCRENRLSFARCGAITYGDFGSLVCSVDAWSINASSRASAESMALRECRLRGNTGCRILTNDNGERMSGCNSQSASSAATTTKTQVVNILSHRLKRDTR